jgi:hypothetical protein
MIRREIFAGASAIVLGVIDCALSCFRIDGKNRAAEKRIRRASDSENVHVFQMSQNHGGALISPQLEDLNSSVPVIVCEVGVGTGSAASCPAGTK